MTINFEDDIRMDWEPADHEGLSLDENYPLDNIGICPECGLPIADCNCAEYDEECSNAAFEYEALMYRRQAESIAHDGYDENDYLLEGSY